MNEASRTIAALCINKRSHYHELAGVECYDIERDVTTFTGQCPIVAHPPCRTWSARCRHQAKPLPGEKELGPLCVDWLRSCGGVLEHPAHSVLFQHCGLPRPGQTIGELWTIQVMQSWWQDHEGIGKPTWLCFAHVPRRAVQIPLTLRNKGYEYRLWQVMPKSLRSRTCLGMAEWLVAAARTSTIL